MAANRSKAQVAARYKAAGVMQPTMKLEGEELQRHLGRRSVKFGDKRTRRNRDRGAQRRNAIAGAY